MAGVARSGRVAGFGLAVMLLLASCAHRPVASVVAPEPVAAMSRPILAPQYAAIVPPPRDADGQYRTINSGIDAKRTMWHVRAALNVAAIGCRGPDDAGLIPAYNALLKDQKAALAGADVAVKADFRRQDGAGWQAAHDAYMTRLYNFFAEPAAKPGFCAAADRIAPQAAAVAADGFPAFAQTALPELEAPFLATYRAVDDYRVALAAWTAGRSGTNRLAAATLAGRPHLAYADMPALIDWAPDTRTQLATR